MSDDWSVGMDGGGTRTRAVLVDDQGRVRARAVGGPGNYQLVGLAGVVELISGLLDGLRAQQGAARGDVALCVALAGAGRQEEQEAICAGLSDLARCSSVSAVSDARAALEGAHGGEAGIIVIAGTGSMVLGKSHTGQEVRAGGLGPLLGDEGSGYRLVLEALRAVLRARDGAGPDTALAAALAQAFDLTDWNQVIGRVYGGDLTRERLAAASPHLFTAVRQGDQVATEILEGEARALGEQVAAVAARLVRHPVDVACLGGVFAEVGLVWPLLAAAAAARGQRVRRVEPLLEPVLGAALLARRASGRAVPVEFVQGLAASGFGNWDQPSPGPAGGGV